MPAVRRQAHRHIQGLATQEPRGAELHPADLGKARGGPLAVQALDLDLPPLKAEGVVHALLAGRGISCAPRQDVGIGLVQIAQGLLLGRHRHGPEITGRYHRGVLWSPSYFAASCGGAPLSVIAEYVKSQREANQGLAFLPA
ncbi:hypothetical protein GGD56_002366 [Rhizobium mongolense]|uniref:Transposase IS200-like domain-containing protein n=2 Tax=Rhizobium mongolense TaxID=57676 RepID=A0ABR6IKZ2_9HYPH|nr:transposase [Rhizobium mongolense]MBB4228524.1 hypothetical protein [Rhizobium mongolense]TVZ63873.1 transposase IS200 family protein [Rhizobium mongolense USDA 1844]